MSMNRKKRIKQRLKQFYQMQKNRQKCKKIKILNCLKKKLNKIEKKIYYTIKI